jgi:alpha-L-arabinofuranosidase
MSRQLMLIDAVIALLVVAGSTRAGEGLQNGGFEGDPPTRDWTVHVFGAQPKIAADPDGAREGRQSLLISSTEPSDAALGQNLLLPPGRLYRLRGWIRTRDLRGDGDARVGGTFQIQDHRGAPRIAGTSHFGTTPWTEEVIAFRVPADGQVRVAVFFAGFGKGTGAAWFDGLRLEEVETPEVERVLVRAERLRDAPASPYLTGQFVEFLCDLVPGMLSERIADDSFEGPVPYRFKYRGDVDHRPRPWYPSGAVHRGEYALDKEKPFNGAVSLRIRAGDGEPCTLGISQDGIYLESGKPLVLRLHLRGEAPAGKTLRAAARLGGPGQALASGSLGEVGSEWRLHQLRLSPAAAARDATLTIEFQGPGTLWLDRVSLVGEDAAPGGWRPDVVAALRDLRPGIIRLGGSSLEAYEWEAGVGDRDLRVPFPDPYWGDRNANNVGLDEFIALCRRVDAEPLICVRWTGKTPRDAANEVEYANGPAETPFGKRRAANGHPEPYRVKFWQIGNEVGGPEYEASVAAFGRAMKEVDPSIRILSSFPSEDVVRNGAAVLDDICPHHYGCADLAGTEQDILRLEELVRRAAGGRAIRLAVTEWNTTAGDWGLARASLLTLDNALKCSRYHNLLLRHSDFVEIANRSNLTNSFCSGVIQTRGPDLYLAPTYHAQRLYARAAGDFPLRIETLLPPAADLLDVAATASADGKRVRLYAVNDSTEAVRRRIDLSAFGKPRGPARLFEVADRDHRGERSATSSFEDPDRIRTATTEIALDGPESSATFEALSVSLLEVEF